MLKIAGFVLAAIVAFLGGITGMLAFTGNLNASAVMQIFGTGGAEPAAPEPEPVGPVQRMLEREREEVSKARAEIDRQREENEMAAQDMNETLARLENLQSQLEREVTALDTDEIERMQGVADAIAGMSPRKAGPTLEEMAPEEAAAILRLIDPKKVGKIIEAVEDPAKRNRILQAMQQPRF